MNINEYKKVKYRDETELVRHCINYLNGMGHFVWRNNSGVVKSSYTNRSGMLKDRIWRAGIKGGADILGLTKDGRFLAVECKVGNNKLTPLQMEFLFEVEKRGGIAITAYDIDDLEKKGL